MVEGVYLAVVALSPARSYTPKLHLGFFVMVRPADAEYMQRALELATRGRGLTWPNPMVGALVVKAGRIIAEGYHQKAGRDHAEIVVLKKAKARARGATLYVTLEPCCHTGKTGPCVEAIISAGIKRVVLGAIDPDPRVNGKGARILRKAGVQVATGLLEKEAVKLNEAFHYFHKTGKPFVTLKMAQTLDGRIATMTGDSKWISCPESLKYAHELRAESDAIVVGGGTVRADNPALTVRLVKGKNPYRILLTTSLSSLRRAKVVRDNRDYRTIVASSAAAIARHAKTKTGKNVMFWSLERSSDGLLSLKDLLKKAKSFGMRSILVEGGAHVATSFLGQGLVDKFVVVMAPMVIGEGLSSLGDLGIAKLANSITFREFQYERIGSDMVFIGYPRKRGK